jgi:hypothetical protein
VQVFPPLRIEPRNITLLIGAAFQVLTTGGPGDVSVEFSLRWVLLLRRNGQIGRLTLMLYLTGRWDMGCCNGRMIQGGKQVYRFMNGSKYRFCTPGIIYL